MKITSPSAHHEALGGVSTSQHHTKYSDADAVAAVTVDTAHIANDAVTGAKLNPSLVLGDIIYADGTDTIARLAKGSETEVLTMGGSNAPTWATRGRAITGDTDNGIITWVTSDNTFAAEAALTYDGEHLTIGDGNLIIGTAGHGIDFSNQASPAAGMTDELLDRYEEGTFSPLLYNQADEAAPSMGATVGRYTRIGNRVHFHFQIQADSISGMNTGSQVVVRGLPFSAVNVANTEHIVSFGHGGGLAITAGVSINGLIGVNEPYIYMQQWTATTGTSDLNISNLSADGKLKGTGAYEVAT